MFGSNSLFLLTCNHTLYMFEGSEPFFHFLTFICYIYNHMVINIAILIKWSPIIVHVYNLF